MKKDAIHLDHGAGGRAFHGLLLRTILPALDNPVLSRLSDGAVVEVGTERLAFSTDSYVVTPLFFPGGDIGELAVYGTVNDVAMCGAEPLFLSLALVMEEGFSMNELERVLHSVRRAADRAGVLVVTGDTKVVPRGAADKLFVNTSGIGRMLPGVNPDPARVVPGDKVILSGTMADHGMAVMAARENLQIFGGLASDTAPLNDLVRKVLMVCPKVHALRDPTRGGVATALNEVAQKSQVSIKIFEDRLPMAQATAGACELLGLDPLYVANEGKFLAFVPEESAQAVLAALRAHPLGEKAAIIGEAQDTPQGRVFLETRIGGTRILDMLNADQLPRIC